jgi:hypothetical protein
MAQSQQDQQQACETLKLQAQAQAALLEAPSAVASLTQSPTVAAPAQMVGGVTYSIQGLRKAKALNAEARTACTLYASTENAALLIQYLPVKIEREALLHRLELDKRAMQEYDKLIADAQLRVDSQNLTRPAFYSLQSGRAKVLADFTQTTVIVSSMYVPELSERSVNSEVLSVAIATALDQQRTAQIQKTQDYDLQLEGGVHKPLFGVGAASPYVGASFTYNLGARKADRAAFAATQAYGAWKDAQIGGVQETADVLKETLENLEHAQHLRLVQLRQQETVIDDNLKSLEGVDTTAALVFKIELESDKIQIGVEIRDGENRFSTLRDMLNYQY